MGSSTMQRSGDFISNTTWGELVWGCLFPQLHHDRLRGMPPPLQLRSPQHHGRASPAKPGPELLDRLSPLRLKTEEKLGKGRWGGNATELIKSFEGDGELSQVHIKGQGNEC